MLTNCHPAHAMVLAVPVTLSPIGTRLFQITLQLLWRSQNIIHTHPSSPVRVVVIPAPQITHDGGFSVHRCSCDVAGLIQPPNRKAEDLHVGHPDMGVTPQDFL